MSESEESWSESSEENSEDNGDYDPLIVQIHRLKAIVRV